MDTEEKWNNCKPYFGKNPPGAISGTQPISNPRPFCHQDVIRMSSTQNEHSCGSYAVLGCNTEDRHLGSSQWKLSNVRD